VVARSGIGQSAEAMGGTTVRYSVFTVSTPDYDPQTLVAKLKDAGYDGVEWRVTDQESAPDGRPGFWTGNRATWPLKSFLHDAPRLRAVTDAAGLAMPTLGTYVSCADLASVEIAMRGAAMVGAPCLRVNVPGYDGTRSWLPARDLAREQYAAVAELAKRFSVRALIELHMGNILPSASAAASFVSRFDPAHVGVVHDAGNMVHEGYENYRLGLEALGPYLAHVHLKNARWDEAGTRPDGSVDWRASFAPLRAGVVDVAALFRALKAVGYDGWVSMEDFSTEVPLDARLVDNLAYARSIEERVAHER